MDSCYYNDLGIGRSSEYVDLGSYRGIFDESSSDSFLRFYTSLVDSIFDGGYKPPVRIKTGSETDGFDPRDYFDATHIPRYVSDDGGDAVSYEDVIGSLSSSNMAEEYTLV